MKAEEKVSPIASPSRRSQQTKCSSAEFRQAQQIGHSRLYPSIFASNYLVLRNRRVHMQVLFARMDRVGALLDVGAQYCPYFPLFADKCDSYTSMDIVDTPIVDIVCNAENMQAGDCSYDLVLCTQVLEHCEHPQRIVDECHRVLKRGGTLVVTAPSIYPVHGYPADNWRFMPDGFRYLLRAFSQVEVLGELDFAESLANVNCHYGHVLTGRMGILGSAINPVWNFATNVCARMLSFGLRPFVNNNFTSFTMNLWAEARK